MATLAELQALSPEELDVIGYQLVGLHPERSLTPYILGLFADCMLLGVCLMQFSRWWQYCHKDERWITRGLVYYVALLNIGITAYLIAWNFDMFVYNFGHYRQFLSIDFASYFYLIDALVRAPVSAFFIERAWRLSGKNWIILGVLGFLAFAAAGLGITCKVLALTIYGSPTFRNIAVAWLVTHLACDAIITITIAVALFRSKTGWKHTDRVVTRLLIMTAETLLPPTILSLAFLIVFLTVPGESWGILFVFSSKVFMICLLVVLNTKFKLRRDLESVSVTRENNTYALKSRTRNPAVVHVMTETYREGLEDDAEQKARIQGDDVESQHTEGADGPHSLNELEYDKNPSQVRLRP